MGGFDPTLIAVVAAAFVSIAGVGWVFAGGASAPKKRVQSVARRDAGRSRRQNSALDQAAQRRRQVQDTLKELEDKQRSQRKRSVSLRVQIEQAGLEISTQNFWLISLAVGATAAAAAFVSGRGPLIALAAGFVVGMGLPRWILGFLRGRRIKKFTEEFANAIDIIVRGVKSGLPLNECLKIIAHESPEPVGGEFRSLVEGLAIGMSLDDGLKKMFDRMPMPELNFFGVVLAIQAKTGGNLAEALSNLSAVLRARKMMREKIQALSSEAKASALIIGSLPPGVMLMVHFTTPTYLEVMFTTPIGKLLLLGGVTWMGAGIFIMRRMINFKI